MDNHVKAKVGEKASLVGRFFVDSYNSFLNVTGL